MERAERVPNRPDPHHPERPTEEETPSRRRGMREGQIQISLGVLRGIGAWIGQHLAEWIAGR